MNGKHVLAKPDFAGLQSDAHHATVACTIVHEEGQSPAYLEIDADRAQLSALLKIDDNFVVLSGGYKFIYNEDHYSNRCEEIARAIGGLGKRGKVGLSPPVTAITVCETPKARPAQPQKT